MAEVETGDEANRSDDSPVAVNDLPDQILPQNPPLQHQWRSYSTLNSSFASANQNIPSPFSFADPPSLQGNPNAPPNAFDLQGNYGPPPQQPFLSPQQSFPQPNQPYLAPQQSFPYQPPPPQQQPYPAPQQSFPYQPPPPQQQPFPAPQQSFPPPQQQNPLPGPQQSFPPPQQPFPVQQPSYQFQLPPPQQQPFPAPPLRLPPLVSYRTVTNEYYQYLPLSQAITRGELDAVKAFLNGQPEAATANLQEKGFTALHSASHNGQVEIVKELLRRMSPDDVVVEREFLYHTPLTAAAIHGSIEIAEALIRKNRRLLEMPGYEGDIPVVSAIITDQKVMARYLYTNTPLGLLLDNNGYHGTLLLSSAIFFKMLDTYVEEASAYLETFDQPKNQGLLGSSITYFSKILGIQAMRQLKKTHLQAQKLLRGISAETSMMSFTDRSINGIFEAMWLAVKFGTVEFIVEMIRTNPELFRVANSTNGKSLFLAAVEYRQEKIFSLLYGLDNKKAQAISDLDSSRNGILHYAGFLAPPERLVDIPGPALQLQRELQWFKEVERIVPDVHAERLNSQSLKPRDLFTSSHANLHKEAEKWMKDTATACSFVAALIVTVTFAAGFTVPGGTDQNVGRPLRIKDNRFTFFIISDIISFFSSSTSVLIFLGILTARYAEDDFLVSLPTKMIAGLSIMFLSIAAMLLAFSAALFTLLYHWPWIVIPVIILVCLPVLLFVLLQYPLLAKMIGSTYGRGIFDRNMKPCF